MRQYLGMLVLAVLLFGACTPETAEMVLKDKDGKVQVTVAGVWKVGADLNEAADIQAYNGGLEKYVMVFTDAKAGFEDGTDLIAYAGLVRTNMEDSLENMERTEFLTWKSMV